MTLFEHEQHPHVAARAESGPVKVADQHATGSAYARFNTRVALATTGFVGSMNCAWVFAAIALVSLPAALTSGNVIVIVGWIAQTFLQLVLLSVIMVGQNVQADASDARSLATYKDAEAILHAAGQIAAHLAAQDIETGRIQAHLLTQDDRLAAIVDQVTAAMIRLQPAPPTIQPDPGSTA